MAEYNLHEDRFFNPDQSVRNYAREIYNSVKSLPIISPHGHVDPAIFSENKSFPHPTQLFLIPDHYIYRMLYSQGVKLESLGIPDVNGEAEEKNAKKIWKIFAEHYYMFNGTPSGVWLDYEFNIVFGIKEKLDGSNALKIYDELNEKIKSPEFLPRNLFEKFNIEVLSTTDAASDDLGHHKKIKSSGWKGRIIPCFRPDAVTDLSNPQWKSNIKKLEEVVGYKITNYKSFIKALEERREFFKKNGAVSTDHGIISPYTHELSHKKADAIFQRALKKKSEKGDAELFTAHMLMEMARMSTDDGLVMQVHAGAYRNHNKVVYEKYGLDKGCDIPLQTEYTKNLKELLNKYGNNPAFTVIVFTLDETNYSRELAPLAGHYPSMKLGPAWWFHDSIEGMTRYREMVTETAGFYNTVGFNDDTRAFVSIPARHDVARRIDSNFLAGLVARHIISLEEALRLAKELTYNLVKKAYKL
ncbi:MAG: glucuronate isomerase [Ignavibacteriales bacterium]|nr:MAG: glucuronate isomerase [Ignavibacteriales bacterium]